MNKAKPFVKWAGGKTQLIKELNERLPVEMKKGDIEEYIEPFVGGGALLFYVAANFKVTNYIVNDKNRVLINAYEVVRDHVDTLICKLQMLEDEFLSLNEDEKKAFYYKNRSRFNMIKDKKMNKNKIETAALFIFLNKTCFNGLFRVNNQGEFNVPYGINLNIKICNEANLRAVSRILQNVEITNLDFKTFLNDLVRKVEHTSFIYIDPPYTVKHGNNGFLMYNEKIFSWENQVELASILNKLSFKGAKIMVSNAYHKDIKALYPEFYHHVVSRPSLISAKNCARGTVSEYILTSYNTNPHVLLEVAE